MIVLDKPMGTPLKKMAPVPTEPVPIDKDKQRLAMILNRLTTLVERKPEPAGNEQLAAILDRLTAILEREPEPEAPVEDRSELAGILDTLKEILAAQSRKRKFEFEFKRDHLDFITSITATEV